MVNLFGQNIDQLIVQRLLARSDRHPILPFAQTRLIPWVFSIICLPHPNHQENKSRALFRARGF
jgi:hypothetical protein